MLRLHVQRMYSASTFFFFNDTATTEIYTLSLHDALPISRAVERFGRLDAIVNNAGIGPISRFDALRVEDRSEEHTSELQSHSDLVCRLLLEKKKENKEGAQQEKTSTRHSRLVEQERR